MPGSMRQRGKNSWLLTIDGPPNPDGSRNQIFESVKGKTNAKKRLAVLSAEIQSGSYVAPARITLAAFLEQWLDQISATKSGKTLDGYTHIIHRHIIPKLGRIGLEHLKPLQIQTYYSEQLKTGRIKRPAGPRTKKDLPDGLSAQTVRHHHTLLHKALKDAVRWQLLRSNPVDAVDPPRTEKVEMKILTPAEMRRLLDAARGTPHYIAIALAVTTGMRRGELMGLRWSDVDLAGKTITVARSLQKAGGRLSMKETKTGKVRSISISDKTVEELKIHKAEQAIARSAIDTGSSNRLLLETDLVCYGALIDPHVLTDAVRKLVDNLPITPIRLHDLRHTHVALLIAQGEHVKVISERLGHSSITVTMDRYGHLFPSLSRSAADKLDESLGW